MPLFMAMHVSWNTQTPQKLEPKTRHYPRRGKEAKEASSCARNAWKDRTPTKKTTKKTSVPKTRTSGRGPTTSNSPGENHALVFVALLAQDCAVTNPVVVWQAPNRSKRGHSMVFVVHEPDKQDRDNKQRNNRRVVVMRGITRSAQAVNTCMGRTAKEGPAAGHAACYPPTGYIR